MSKRRALALTILLVLLLAAGAVGATELQVGIPASEWAFADADVDRLMRLAIELQDNQIATAI